LDVKEIAWVPFAYAGVAEDGQPFPAISAEATVGMVL
jgi:hypothetical protein